MKQIENFKPVPHNKILEQEFSYVYQRCKGKIERKVFYLTSSKQEMEDIAQEVFLKLWLKWPLLNTMPEDNLEDYIYTMVANHVCNLRKRSDRIKRHLIGYMEIQSDYYCPDEIMLREGLKIYSEAISQLPSKEKEVYLLYDNDLGRLAIAGKVQRSKNTINNQLYTASKAVKGYLSRKLNLTIWPDGRRKFVEVV
jgi:RNA polymerase sigma factor (sigma-70 family)